MATDVPISDVLCEAMEYLSKLGANLRTRSENLKERRIRKDKLQNTHAVQQAVNKVLLICELSKKSLENVEKEVKRIQSRVDRSQASIDDNEKERRNYYYIPYLTQKLRIAKKIPIKHYMSAKVHASKMSIAMQNKYPVYYDCKLFRQRQKLGKKKKIVSKSDEEKSDNEQVEQIVQNGENSNKHSDIINQSDSESLKNVDYDTNITSSNIEKEIQEDCNNATNTSHLNIAKELKQAITSEDSLSKPKDIVIHDKNDSEEDKSDSQVGEKQHYNEKSKEKSKSPKKCDSDRNLNKSISPNKVSESDRKEADNTKKEKKRRKSNRHVRIISDSSSENENGTNKESQKCEESKEAELAVNEISSSNIKSPPNKKRKLILSDDESDHASSAEVTSNLNDENNKDNKENCEDTSNKKKVTPQPDSEDAKELSDQDSQATQESCDAKFDSGKRPLIKCVSISKLLKPEIVNKSKDITSQKNLQITQKVTTATTKSEINSTKMKEKKTQSTISELFKSKSENNLKKKEEDKYWEKKRLEVNNFKPKIFKINVSRLPDITQEFLKKYKIMRVICKGSVVCELTVNNSNSEKDTNKIKKSLLIDSDSEELRNDSPGIKISDNKDKNCKSRPSDECPRPESEDSSRTMLQQSSSNIHKTNIVQDKSSNNSVCMESEKIKSSLLNDSDSDEIEKDESGNKDKHNSIEITLKSNCELNKSTVAQSDENQDEKSIEDSPNKIKLALLNSSDDSDNKTTEQNKNKSSLKKKCLMQSLEAKKMLLKYSSSSEDEGSQKGRFRGNFSDVMQKKRHRHKRRRKKSQISSGSSSDGQKKQNEDSSNSNSKKGSTENKDSDDGDSQNSELGEKANHSDTSSSKMVRSKAKPGSSISNNSDTQDLNDKDVDRLTNLKGLNKQSRRHSASDNSDDVSKRSIKRGSKPYAMQEMMLKAECSSDAEVPSADESIGAQEEYPPPAPIDLNNGLSHMAKDDLLGDSDSSVSQNEQEKNSEDAPNVEESEEDNMKSKRRKANAISSDSEAGSSRKKDRDTERLSDFEDSEDENSEPAKKSKRKKKGSESDASAGSSEDGTKKKRRRIKQINESDLSDSDGETEGRNKHGRKNIRKVMGKNQLEEATKKAAREEKERIARIAERQKLYNNLEFDESGKPDEVVLEKVVLDFDPETKEPLIEVDRGLVKKLKPHQANGIKFMWDACFESVKRIKKDRGSGCILAHCMGLGKTLQVISLAHTLLTHGALTGVRRVLVVCPLSTVLNWVNEFRMWLKHAHNDFDVDVYELSRHKQNSERAFQLGQWFSGGGVCVLGYEMFRNLSADNNKKFKKKMLKNFQESLVDPGPDLVVCDEGHLLKNEKTSLSQSMNKVKTRRRIVLTGTPLQNNLKEYYCMVQFVKPNLLGKYNEYLNRFVNPITNGQYTDSTEHDIRVMKRRSHVLHKMLDGAVQRRDYGVLAPFLPPKHEYVLFITLSEVQIKLYQYYLDNYSRRPLPGKSSGFLFPDFQSLQRIWTHPLVLKYNSERYEIMQQKKREREEEDSEGSLRDFIDDDSTSEETSTEESSDDLSDMSDDSRKKNKKKKSAKKAKNKETKVTTRRGTRANPVEHDSDDMDTPEVVEAKNENPTEWWIKLVNEDELEDMRNSHKLVLLFDILRQCETIGDKLLVFSQSLYSLDLIEHYLGKVDEATQEGRIDEKLGGHVGSWSPGVDYFRLDGSTSCENRSIWCKNFNREDNPRARLFLISTRAGGLGINLVAANRVVIFDVSWNPSHDVQSIFRVYRFGQKKPCYVYRFLAMGTMEEKIYERQVTKQAISKRVIDEQQIDRHYAENDLAELYKFEPRAEAPREVPALPKDRLFAEMLREHEPQIFKYHEHDSLLENKEEETLTEEERKAAWEDFENEKNKPPPAPFPTAWPMHNGMVPGLLAQQQQQLAYAALAAMLRKDIPNINDNQIRDMLPLIFNSNPGMMQKMSEIYKYAQPGMMNPGMMNPAMNAGGSALGGSSGLQYEPPWQRQHQQQQQMRLQQLMQQQQNHMGAKYYAGGLGSRDPVAMALQQQRAREIMLGGGAGGGSAGGRPRGRPPLQPRAPPAAHDHDIVNLDSD